jgi:polyisoprenoid-binding protein YceI
MDLDARLEGELDFHGVKRPLSVPAKLSLAQDGTAVVKAKFPVNLEAHQIERPSLLFVKVDENVELDVQLKLRAAK